MDFQAFWQMIPAPLRAFIVDRICGLLTAVAGALVTAGALKSDEVQPFVAIGLGLLTYAAGEVWSWMREREIPKLKAQLAQAQKDLADWKRRGAPAANPAPPGGGAAPGR